MTGGDGGSVVMPGRPPQGAGGAGGVSGADASSPPGMPGAADAGAAGSGLDAGAARDAGDAGALPSPTDFVFDEKKLSEWRLTLSAADLKKLDDTALMELYVPATLTVDGEDAGQVGLRYKGGYASFRACFVNNVNTCKKLSYKVDFAEYNVNQRFHGLKKINLHSHKLDGSHLRERLAYKMFRQHGIPASRSVHAKVFVNGAYKGLFGLTEEVDGRFTRLWWPGAGDGNLYKETWPQSADPKVYVAGQKTNEPDPTDPTKKVVPPTKILEFQQALYAASPADLPKVIDSWMNVDYLMKVLVIDHAVSNWDGPLTFYCFPNCTNHNFYIYESETEKRLWLIPWDLDFTFNVTDPREKAILTPWDKPPADCSRRFLAFPPSTNIMHPGCDRVYRGLALAGRPLFVAAVNQLLAGPFNPDRMRADIDVWAAQISEAVRLDSNGPAFANWQGDVTRLKTDLDQMRAKLIALRDVKP